MTSKLKLLPKELLIKTNPIDHADWNFRPFLGYIQRKRFQLAISKIGNNIYNQILEIGYGSGIFMPALSQYCKNLFGIDTHPFNKKVSEILLSFGISASLYEGSVTKMPFENNSFDLIVSVSTFEFIEDKEAACLELRRVLTNDGLFIIITPGESWILDLGLKILTRESAKKDYGNKRQNVHSVLMKHFNVLHSTTFPGIVGRFFSIYKAFVLSPKA